MYSYVSVGEFIAFTIGWNLILEYVIGTASVAKGMALYIDSLCNNSIARTMIEVAPIKIPFMADYPDFFAFSLVLLITGKLLTHFFSFCCAIFIIKQSHSNFFKAYLLS